MIALVNQMAELLDFWTESHLVILTDSSLEIEKAVRRIRERRVSYMFEMTAVTIVFEVKR